MTENLLLGILASVFGPLMAFLAAMQVRQAKQHAEHRTEFAKLKTELKLAETRERILWGWARGLVDQVYRLGGVPIEVPEYLDDLFPTEKVFKNAPDRNP